MAVQGNNSDEDYLDNLLKSVLGGQSEEEKKKQNTDGDDKFLSDEDLFKSVDEDLFEQEIQGIDSDAFEEELNSLASAEDLGGELKPENKADRAEGKKKKEKRGFFGRKKKSGTEKALEETDVKGEEQETSNAEVSKTEASKAEVSNAEVSKAEAEKYEEPKQEIPEASRFEEGSDTEPEQETEAKEDFSFDDIPDLVLAEEHMMPEPPEFMKELLDDEGGEESSDIDEDMKGLYDILGMPEEESPVKEESKEELKALEEETKTKGKKKGKKKGLFKRKKKKEDLDVEPLEAPLNEAFFNTEPKAEENAAPLSGMEDLGSDVLLDPRLTMENTDTSMPDLGIEGLDNIFGDSELEESPGDENSRLIEEMSNGDFDEEEIMSGKEEPKKKKKDKKKKDKKPKKEKKKKPKKVKKKKPEKPKKAKPPGEVIKIPKAFLLFSFSVIVLIVVLLIVGGNYINYREKKEAALAYYLNQDYEAAYSELVGLKMNGDDQFFFDRLEVIMYVQRHYSSYKNLYELKKYDQALHTLLRGVKMYDKYNERAREPELDCFEDMVTVLGWIDTALLEKYGLTESAARELNLIEDQYEYARKVYEISDIAKEREEALEEESRKQESLE